MNLRNAKRLIFAVLAVSCLAGMLHCGFSGEARCEKVNCAIHCCLTARIVQPQVEIIEPEPESKCLPPRPQIRISRSLPKDIFHPPAA